MRLSGAVVLLLFAPGMAGCTGPRFPSPTAPASTPTPQPSPSQVIVFTDQASGFSTSDLHDAQEQIVRVNSRSELIWVADDVRFPGFPTQRQLILADTLAPWLRFEVRFGTRNAERRAYLVWFDDYNHYYPGTVVDIDVVGGQLVARETQLPVPKT